MTFDYPSMIKGDNFIYMTVQHVTNKWTFLIHVLDFTASCPSPYTSIRKQFWYLILQQVAPQ